MSAIPEINKVHHGDCIALLREMPDESADLIFADPPYNLQLNRDLFRPDKSRVDAVADGWDKFASFEQYDEFTTGWLTECRRVLKDTGSIWVIGTYHNIFRVGAIMQDLGFWLLNDIIWLKTNPMPNFMGTRFTNAHETLIWAARSKSSKYTFHYHSMKVMNDDLQMRSDWVLPVCHGNERIKKEGRRAHPTQKPEELLRRIILAASSAGDLVVDPFSGTGTTAVVAKQLGRRFVAFEKEEEYVTLARRRLLHAKPVETSLLNYNMEDKRNRVTFGNLVETGMIAAGERLYSKDRRHEGLVQADASVKCKGATGSIHKISAMFSKSNDSNGWSFWYAERKGRLTSIEKIKREYVIKYRSLTGDSTDTDTVSP